MNKKRAFILMIFLVLSIFIVVDFVKADLGCNYYDHYLFGGVDGCKKVYDWGDNQAIKSRLLNKAENNPGTRYMAWCPSQDAIPTIRSDYKLNTCDCPSVSEFNLDPGECDTKRCSNCNNYVTLCSPEPKPICGDDKINQASEQCDWGTDNGKVCTPDWNNECTYCTDSCQLKTKYGPTCSDECSLGDKECHGNDLWECGDYDSDPCLEFGFKKDCSATNVDTSYECENDDSVEITETTNGFCKDNFGHNDYCDSDTIIEKEVTDCGYTVCTEDEFCQNNDVYSQETCIEKGCYEPTGKCFAETDIKDPVLEEDCRDSQTDEFCSGENIVYGWQDETCVKVSGDAYCDPESGTELVEECGPDVCISHTELDPFEFEYVEDLNSCEENGHAYCALPENPVDMCHDEDILLQPFCDGRGYDWESVDCNQYDDCYEFEVDQCFYCPDNYGNCYEKTCSVTGLKYIDYQCGSGVCYGEEKEMVDADKDHKDDEYCDDCIDVDRDGICDDVDNCPGVWNENQIDNDKDGYGNACDLDRDGDGYPEGIDCNDWDPKIHPGAKEIPNNGRDEDCNPNTPDFIPNTPREILYVDIQMQDEATLRAGEEFTIVVSVANKGLDNIGDLRLSVSLPGFQERQVKLIRKLKSGDGSARIFTFRLPEDLKTKYEYLRVSVSNDKYKRIIYREVKLPQ